MSEAERKLRERVKRDLRWDIPDLMWEQLKDLGFVNEAINFDAYDGLLARAREFGAMARLSPQAPSLPVVRYFHLANPEGDRADAIAGAIGELAENMPEVQDFWNNDVGRPMTEEEATRVFALPASALLSINQMKALDLSPFDASILIDGDAYVREDGRRAIDLRDASGNRTLRATEAPQPHVNWSPQVTCRRRSDQETLIAHAMPGSFLDRIRELSLLVAERTTMEAKDAAWFLMTREEPLGNPPIAGWTERTVGKGITRGRIVLEIEPWVSVQTVEKAFRTMQKDLRLETGDNISMEVKTLRVFEFVHSALHAGGRNVRFREVARCWNEACETFREGLRPEWRFQKLDSLKTLYDRAARQLLQPNYHIPGDDALDGALISRRVRWEPTPTNTPTSTD